MWSTEGSHRALLAGGAIVSGAGMVVFPLFPTLQATHGVSTASLGVVSAAGFLAAGVAELLVAPQADRGHARRMVLGSFVLMVLSLGLLAVAADVATLVASRGLGGFAFGMFASAAAGLLVRAEPGRAGEQLGRLAAAELGGLAVGPMLAALALHLGVGTTATAAGAAVAVAVATLMCAPWLPTEHGAADTAGTADTADRAGAVAVRTAPPRLALDLLRSRATLGAALLTVAVMIPTGAYDAIWPRFLADLGADDLLIGLSFTAFAVPYVVVAAPAGRLADRIGGMAAAWRGMALVVAVMTVYTWVPWPVPAALVGFVESAGQAVAATAAGAAMAQAVIPARAAAAQGLARAMGTAAATVVSVVSGAVYAAGGALPLFGGTIVLVAITMGAATVLVRTAPRTRTARSTAVTPGGPVPAHSSR